MGEDPVNDPWITDVPPGTTNDLIEVLVREGFIEDLGPRTARQRWKKPLTFALAHGVRTGAIPAPVLRVLLTEARKMLKGAMPMNDAELRQAVNDAWTEGMPQSDVQEDGEVINSG